MNLEIKVIMWSVGRSFDQINLLVVAGCQPIIVGQFNQHNCRDLFICCDRLKLVDNVRLSGPTLISMELTAIFCLIGD